MNHVALGAGDAPKFQHRQAPILRVIEGGACTVTLDEALAYLATQASRLPTGCPDRKAVEACLARHRVLVDSGALPPV